MNLSEDGQYLAACNKYYEIKHDCLNDTLFKHPNIYFNESVKHRTSYHGEIYFIILCIHTIQTIYYIFCIKFKITLTLKI